MSAQCSVRTTPVVSLQPLQSNLWHWMLTSSTTRVTSSWGHASPGEGLHPVSPMNTCNLLLYPWVSRIRAHLSSTPATGMWEDAHCKLLSVSGCNVSISRQWLHCLGDWVKMQEGEQLIYLLGEMQKGVFFFSLWQSTPMLLTFLMSL